MHTLFDNRIDTTWNESLNAETLIDMEIVGFSREELVAETLKYVSGVPELKCSAMFVSKVMEALGIDKNI